MIDFKSNQVFFMFGVLVWGIVFWETSDDVSFFCTLLVLIQPQVPPLHFITKKMNRHAYTAIHFQKLI
jgi:hypothetical protein